MPNQPLSANEMPRFAGQGTFMRLPAVTSAEGLDVTFLGIPMDHGASWRSGTRFGPSQIRHESAMVRPYGLQTGAAPFDKLNCADLGDIAVNTFDLKKTISIITDFYDDVLKHDTIPMTLGGDHTITLPILRSIAKKYGPVGLIHVDAHADVNDEMFGERETHGTVFRRAYEEGLLRPKDVWQIGLRGTGYTAEDFDEPRDWGFNLVLAQDIWHKSTASLAAEIKTKMGEGPVYMSYDIDSLDPSIAPGTGTPEIGGLTTPQALELIRGLRGLDFVGADLVEVSPPYDRSGNTALTAANLLYEILCVLPGVAYR